MQLTQQQTQMLKDQTKAQNILSMQNKNQQSKLPLKSQSQTTQIQSKIQQSKPQTEKHFFFQTQTKRLKQYYLHPENRSKLISRRILFNNSVGIVRYFGQLKHQGAEKGNQLWIGVQWQQKNRGKHNGTVKGYKYFQCQQNQGSMVKYQKIQFGYKLETALFKRYFRSEEMHHARNIYEELKNYKKQLKTQTEQIIVQKGEQKMQKPRRHVTIEYDAQAYFDSLKKSKKILVQFVGFDQIWTKINNLDKIQSISLPECRICDFGPKGHLNQLLKSLKILSLEDNILSHYNQIYQLGWQLPCLEQLSLTNNILAEPQLPYEQMKEIQIVGYDQAIQVSQNLKLFQKLKTLILINTGLKWRTLFKIIKSFTNKLRQLVVCRNDMTDYQNIQANKLECFSQLTFLNLEDTNLSDFKNVMIFKDLPNLQKLTLNNNPISQFGRQITGFNSLKSLSVQKCTVSKPVVIYELSQFKNVQNFNFRHNPLNQIMGNAYVRLRSIAEFQKLTIINGAPLKKYERKDSQIYYLRETFRQYFALKNKPDYDYDFDDFLKWCQQFHPNIQLFIKKFGNPYEVQKKKQIQQIIKNEVKQTQMKKGTGMVKVKLYYQFLQTTDSKKIPLTWTVANLKNFFAKTVKLPAGNQTIIHKNESQGKQEQINQDHKPLSFYNLSDQSTIILKRKDNKGGVSFVV